MGTNFNVLWNDPEFINNSQKQNIDKEVELISNQIKSKRKKIKEMALDTGDNKK